ncbi:MULTISPECIES: ABC transporter ATP-binding protein [Methanocorpusculum]|jgi:NitT/TauT family transport system ATP-binding protein|uniref:ABC transporter ATP-binding protein n=1 Tax=Methanocorpusculum TaxID=2192 RepID=UPI0005B2C270|nr:MULTISPECIES: ABC transporter ATP-binding protein [Methanocorpusculum]MDD2248763.1 ABC transporter ATP-binding protein [Methanocorpusculum sp.]MDD4423397.1 ABC transporter ATP-binding protein [Methanocorpusculum parvum]MDD2802841.1 ABC transporter ATP-binding protein [Methanocorpusculum sp.]MDD3046773.1 ABC transporter ATP-binding protein [Methanocorpusculum sp.]MDD3911917.1 ABC transporter ATP-binding protein [Methanocorpusculum sp.]
MTDWDKVWVKVEDATKTFSSRKGDVTALEHVNLEVHDGQFVCLLGPSGCGKTTLLRMIGGLDVPTSGKVSIDGKIVDGPSPKMTMVFQEYSLYPWRTVAENVGFGLEMMGVSKEERIIEVNKRLALVGLTGFADSYPYELSGGMRQRAAVARALASDPAVMLMDEPFGALDAQTRNKMQRELLQIWEETKKTILFVTHSVDEAVYLSDKIVILTPRPGRIYEIYPNTLPRPRDRTSVEFAKLRKDVLAEIEKLEGENENL